MVNFVKRFCIVKIYHINFLSITLFLDLFIGNYKEAEEGLNASLKIMFVVVILLDRHFSHSLHR